MGENQDKKVPNPSELSNEEESDKRELKNEDLDHVSGGLSLIATCGICNKTLDKCRGHTSNLS